MTLGATLALLYLRGTRWPVAGILHGLLGAAGLCLLVIALQGPRRGDAMGVGSFGIAAAVLFGIALACGPFILPLLKRSPPIAGIVIAAHATLAIAGFVMFLAWVSM